MIDNGTIEHRGQCDVSKADKLPVPELPITGLRLGEVRYDSQGKPQAYFGGETIDRLTPYDTVTMRDGAVVVSMFTLDASTERDYAVVEVRPPAYFRTATERGEALRFGGGKPAFLIERTPVQKFTSERIFNDIPLSGRARWLALNPEGVFSTGVFDDRDVATHNSVATFSEGWTFVWIAEGARPFRFGELCTPRFIDVTSACPIGEEGIIELDDTLDEAELPDRFKQLFDLYVSGEHLRNQSPR